MLEPIAPLATTPPHSAPHPSAFRTLLSELNPLQYLPVIGTIYRAITGDTIPERARLVGGFVASGLLAGPIGLAWDAAEVAVEKATGIDPEKIGRTVLADIGIGAPPAPPRGWTPAQLAAYAAPPAASPATHAALTGAEALNQRELDRLAAQRA